MISFQHISCPLCGSNEIKALEKPMKVDALIASLGNQTVFEATIANAYAVRLSMLNRFLTDNRASKCTGK
jgi:hypothetical protein